MAALFAGQAGGLANLLFGINTVLTDKITTESGAIADDAVVTEIKPAFASIGVSAVQATDTARPILDDDGNPGRYNVTYAGDNHLRLTGFSGSIMEVILLIDAGSVGDGERVIFTQDTSNGATTKSAWEIFLTTEPE